MNNCIINAETTTVTKQKIPTALNPPMARNAPPSDEPRTPPNRLLPLIMPTAVARDWPETSVAKVWNTGQPTLNTLTAPNAMNTVTQIAGSIANNHQGDRSAGQRATSSEVEPPPVVGDDTAQKTSNHSPQANHRQW
jgi:hypothetical protein